jgi:hypothetical protein
MSLILIRKKHLGEFRWFRKGEGERLRLFKHGTVEVGEVLDMETGELFTAYRDTRNGTVIDCNDPERVIIQGFSAKSGRAALDFPYLETIED